ncbi:hypothetical protein EJ08DRAFT_450052 [Tothia fuscella]|uniref:Uncharacterized protein n=1 Tax=Tothia fuscella TaxID=1048955 RepID=A0A9P4NJF8_9PEZI|nr:hypothetical protein EJ08DRAFT_450052 [Tothia fuscella]
MVFHWEYCKCKACVGFKRLSNSHRWLKKKMGPSKVLFDIHTLHGLTKRHSILQIEFPRQSHPQSHSLNLSIPKSQLYQHPPPSHQPKPSHRRSMYYHLHLSQHQVYKPPTYNKATPHQRIYKSIWVFKDCRGYLILAKEKSLWNETSVITNRLMRMFLNGAGLDVYDGVEVLFATWHNHVRVRRGNY